MGLNYPQSEIQDIFIENVFIQQLFICLEVTQWGIVALELLPDMVLHFLSHHGLLTVNWEKFLNSLRNSIKWV